MGPLHTKAWLQLDKKNKTSKKKIGLSFKKKQKFWK